VNPNRRLWFTRLLIAVVTLWNLQAALVFILRPQVYTPGFMLAGLPGETAVRGVGVLFLMWNVPYLVALWDPRRYQLALALSLAMQLVGVVGETLIFLSVPADYSLLRASIVRFILFDAAGAVFLTGANWLVSQEQP